MKVRATQAIMECLLEQEVDTVFGYPGGTILNLYDELYHYQDRIHHVLTAHNRRRPRRRRLRPLHRQGVLRHLRPGATI